MSVSKLLFPAVQVTSDDGLSFGDIIENLPTDGASIFTLVILAAAVAFVLWSGRTKGKGDGAA